MRHVTESTEVLGYIDSLEINENTVKASGWCMTKEFECKPLRLLEQSIITSERPDVAKYYKIDRSKCGWSFEATLPCELQMKCDEWVTVFSFKESTYSKLITNPRPTISSYIVIDNFYEDPDSIRKFALTATFREHVEYHKGKRTDECYRFPGLKRRFEEIIGKKIQSWEKYGTNGCFQYCVKGDDIVYHYDKQQYAGVLYLTPDAPVEAGTSLFRSRLTKKMKVSSDQEHAIVFAKGYTDPSDFEMVDTIGNVYNRLILFDSKVIHAATSYFGSSLENGRLFQLFFFDLEG